MRSFIKYLLLNLVLLVIYAIPSYAVEVQSSIQPITLHESVGLDVFNRALNSDKEVCQATNGSLFPLGALGNAHTLLEYTAPEKSTGCLTGTVLIVDNAKLKNLIERDKNFQAHMQGLKSATAKEVRLEITKDTTVQMLAADNDKGIDWGVVQMCTISQGNYLIYRNLLHGDGLPVVIFFYGKDQGATNEGSCPENSYVVTTQSQFNQIFGSKKIVLKQIPSQPIAQSYQAQSVSVTKSSTEEVVGPDEDVESSDDSSSISEETVVKGNGKTVHKKRTSTSTKKKR